MTTKPKTIKVWLENQIDQEREVSVEKLAHDFIEWRKKTKVWGYVENLILQFLSEQKIGGKSFVWEVDGGKGVNAIADEYFRIVTEEDKKEFYEELF